MEKPKTYTPYRTGNLFNRITVGWMGPLMRLGYKRPLLESDMFDLVGNLTADDISGRLDRAWEAELNRPSPSLLHALMVGFGKELLLPGIGRFIGDTSNILSPLIVQQLILFLQTSDVAEKSSRTPPPVWFGYVIAVVLFLMQCIAGFLTHKTMESLMITGLRVKTAIIAGLYKKCLRLSSLSRQIHSTGRIVNLMSTDAARLDRATAFLHFSWSAPYQLVVAVAILFWQLGWTAIFGFVTLFAVIPIQSWAQRFLSRLRKEASAITDNRVRTTQEVIQGIRVCKFYAWEKPFYQMIIQFRMLEMLKNRKMLIMRAVVAGVTTLVPTIASVLLFVGYVLSGHQLDVGTVFLVLSLTNILRIPLLVLPILVTELTDAKVAIDRIQTLLLADELDALPTAQKDALNQPAIIVKNATFAWEQNPDSKQNSHNSKSTDSPPEDKCEKEVETQDDSEVTSLTTRKLSQNLKSQLKDIDFVIPKGHLVAMVGAVGSGKSSLLQGLIGEMKKMSGSVTFTGSVGYCAQSAWIQNATLKDNILFGREFNEKKYKQCLKCCALERDLTVLPASDLTEIGERGINLSGGQKQRVNIARAVYFDPDIVLLDDPLSAVDAHVGRQLFENCINGELKHKTRILVTHQLHFLPSVDYILLMEEGRIAEQGTYESLMTQKGAFFKLMENYGGIHSDDSEDSTIQSSSGTSKISEGPSQSNKGVQELRRDGTEKETDEKAPAVASENARLMQQEDRQLGHISGKVFLGYLNSSGGWLMGTGILTVVSLAQVFKILTDLWLTWWSSKRFTFSQNEYIGIYVGLGVVQGIFSILSGVIFAYGGTKAAVKMHERALSKIFRAPSSFFDQTPLGRIMNRFSKDIDVIDILLPESWRQTFYTFSLIFSTLVLIGIIFPFFLLGVLPFIVLFYFVQLFYRATSRELKRLENISRSPLFSHFSESLSGLATIRAYHENSRFINENLQMLDKNNRVYFPVLESQRWLGLRLELMAGLLIGIAAILSVALRQSVGAGIAGLAISYSLQVTGFLNWFVRTFTDTEQSMNSAERVLYYANELEEEAEEINPDFRPPSDKWPERGSISFEELTVRYRSNLDPVLHGITFSVREAEKVAIVGRTGAGKSTIIQTLMRLIEPESGKILIDGVDITKLGLFDLRSRLAVIPQDPVLFSGTLRTNLDPFSEKTDLELWNALEQAGLKAKIAAEPFGLDAIVSEGGDNWSNGQKQLICLSRAMLKNCQIIILDEATASIDLATDNFIQTALRKEPLNTKTILTIAHRLNTVIDYDKILVLDHGRIVEFDSPATLLENPNGHFTSMIEETGAVNAAIHRHHGNFNMPPNSKSQSRRRKSKKSPYSIYFSYIAMQTYETLRTLFSIFVVAPYTRIIESHTTQKVALNFLVFTVISLAIISNSIGLYSIFYSSYMPKALTTVPAYLQFQENETQPYAYVSLNRDLKNDKILGLDQRYQIGIEIVAPDSERNLELGNFMISMTLCSKDNKTIAQSIRPALLRYKSPLFRLVQTSYKILPLLWGHSLESQRFRVVLFENFMENELLPVHHALITLSDSQIRVYETNFIAEAQFEGLRYFMYHWWLTTGGIFIFSTLFWESLFAYFAWKWFLAKYGSPLGISDDEEEDDEDYKEVSEDFEYRSDEGDGLHGDAAVPEISLTEQDRLMIEERRRRQEEYERRVQSKNGLTSSISAIVGSDFSEMLNPGNMQFMSAATSFSQANIPFVSGSAAPPPQRPYSEVMASINQRRQRKQHHLDDEIRIPADEQYARRNFLKNSANSVGKQRDNVNVTEKIRRTVKSYLETTVTEFFEEAKLNQPSYLVYDLDKPDDLVDMLEFDLFAANCIEKNGVLEISPEYSARFKILQHNLKSEKVRSELLTGQLLPKEIVRMERIAMDPVVFTKPTSSEEYYVPNEAENIDHEAEEALTHREDDADDEEGDDAVSSYVKNLGNVKLKLDALQNRVLEEKIASEKALTATNEEFPDDINFESTAFSNADENPINPNSGLIILDTHSSESEFSPVLLNTKNFE
ncbi:hypothetical protein HK098_003997 [Nowakowskiella sp. JEL0407]|nr:hypothetical protein HK098_003997 [Nowakowskiella sp. JEL0407]